MAVVNRIAAFAEDMKTWRHWMHRNPEIGFDLPKTAAFVAARLREFGVDELHEGIAQSGMVAIINGQGAGATIGLRADMDALPIHEATGAPMPAKRPARCTPAAMTGTPRCCWGRRDTWRKRAISGAVSR